VAGFEAVIITTKHKAQYQNLALWIWCVTVVIKGWTRSD